MHGDEYWPDGKCMPKISNQTIIMKMPIVEVTRWPFTFHNLLSQLASKGKVGEMDGSNPKDAF